MIRRKSCGFIKVFMLEESAANANIIKSVPQCESLTFIACYASRIMGVFIAYTIAELW